MKKELLPTLKLSFEMTKTLSNIEYNGLKVNLDTLAQIKVDYENEMEQLEIVINQLAQEAMGDTPINLASPDDRSMLLYSRKVTDKKMWAQSFNIGHEMRGSTSKPKMRKRVSSTQMKQMIRNMTEVVYKTQGFHCHSCKGTGRFSPLKKDGTQGKALRICKQCDGKGVIYKSTGKVAGFKLVPRNVHDIASAGFKSDKVTLEERTRELTLEGQAFAKAYIRYNALRTYLSTFVNGMENNVDSEGFIHPEFMQCVTATGRLSSRNPNFQNMPRGSTFEIRKVVESRFDGGWILEGDYSQLEFRVAGFLGKDKAVYEDVTNEVDVHSYTASVIGCSRQEAKAHTFKPLYGGVTGTADQQRYYRAFKEKYDGIKKWHEQLQYDAVHKKQVTLPSGRAYAFPDTKWTEWGTATNRTAICNYPVQGFATADLLPIALVRLDNSMINHNLKSVICNTVHDSIVVDVHPDEKDICIKLMAEAMKALPEETEKRYSISYDMPVGIELKIGKNWLDLDVVPV